MLELLCCLPRSSSGSGGSGPPPKKPIDLPYLDPNRQPISEDVPAGTNAGEVETQPAPFFRLLPPEIRRQILNEAFGEQTIHVHLAWDYPRKTPQQTLKKERPPITSDHGGPYAPWSNERSSRYIESRDWTAAPQTRVWQWYSCVCHRNDPSGQGFVPLRYDQCLTGEAAYCPLWPGDAPDKCKIGVMGWLLSCRQRCVLTYSSRLSLSQGAVS